MDEFEEGDEAELLPSGITFTNVTVPVVIYEWDEDDTHWAQAYPVD